MSDERASPERSLELSKIALFCVFGFVLMASYAMARPAAESLFLAKQGSGGLPRAWIAVAVIVVIVVSIYNRYSAGKNLLAVFSVSVLVSATLLLLVLLALVAELPGAELALYVWKDVYVVVLVEIFWTYANLVFPIRTARWAYGLFLAAGSAGGITGNLVVGPLAKALGTVGTLWLIIPLFVVLYVGTRIFSKTEHDLPVPARDGEDASHEGGGLRFATRFITETASVISRSRYLALLLLLIVSVQLVINLVDFQFNQVIEQTYPDVDARTEVMGQVYASINFLSLLLQLASGIVLRYVGVSATLLSIPLFLGATIFAFLISPRFLTMAIAKAASKIFDYSLFRAGKEILYIPLDYEEKTRGKAVIDMLAYRVTKGAASILLIALERASATRFVTGVNLALCLAWLGLTLGLVRMFKRRQAESESEAVAKPAAGS